MLRWTGGTQARARHATRDAGYVGAVCPGNINRTHISSSITLPSLSSLSSSMTTSTSKPASRTALSEVTNERRDITKVSKAEVQDNNTTTTLQSSTSMPAQLLVRAMRAASQQHSRASYTQCHTHDTDQCAAQDSRVPTYTQHYAEILRQQQQQQKRQHSRALAKRDRIATHHSSSSGNTRAAHVTADCLALRWPLLMHREPPRPVAGDVTHRECSERQTHRPTLPSSLSTCTTVTTTTTSTMDDKPSEQLVIYDDAAATVSPSLLLLQQQVTQPQTNRTNSNSVWADALVPDELVTATSATELPMSRADTTNPLQDNDMPIHVVDWAVPTSSSDAPFRPSGYDDVYEATQDEPTALSFVDQPLLPFSLTERNCAQDESNVSYDLDSAFAPTSFVSSTHGAMQPFAGVQGAMADEGPSVVDPYSLQPGMYSDRTQADLYNPMNVAQANAWPTTGFPAPFPTASDTMYTDPLTAVPPPSPQRTSRFGPATTTRRQVALPNPRGLSARCRHFRDRCKRGG